MLCNLIQHCLSNLGSSFKYKIVSDRALCVVFSSVASPAPVVSPPPVAYPPPVASPPPVALFHL